MDERFVVRLDVLIIKSAKERAKKLYETLEQIDKELETHEFKEIPTELKAMLKKDVEFMLIEIAKLIDWFFYLI